MEKVEYQPVIGLEVHVELNTKSKMFCACKNDSVETRPNVNICPICTSQPGVLPVINKKAVEKVIKTGLALDCGVLKESRFDRKNYFYPDLPKGYQISQYDTPLCAAGFLEITRIGNNHGEKVKNQRSKIKITEQNSKIIRIRRVHLEEDTARLIHPAGADYSLVDFNRAGIPLMELVTEPDLSSAKEARKFAEELQLILRYLGVSEADMEKGQLRVEANVSLLQLKSKIPSAKSQINSKSQISNPKLGTKVEIKNLNSFRAVEKAIEYEIERQEEILKSGKKIIQETRGWNDVRGATTSQRKKEEAHDYRYFPEPDLPMLRIGNPKSEARPQPISNGLSRPAFIKGLWRNPKQILNSNDQNSKHEVNNVIDIEKIRVGIPELPWQKRIRFQDEYYLEPKDAEVFVQQKELGEYFEKVLSELRNWVKEEEGKREVMGKEFKKLVNLAKNYLAVDLLGLLGGGDIGIDDEQFPITPENFAEFLKLLYKGEISSKIAKMILKEMFKTGTDPSHIIEEKGLTLITEVKDIEEVIKEVIIKNQKAVEDFKKGKEQSLQFLIGQVMRETQGRAKPETIKDLLTKLLGEVK